jgi:hypothetical protein
MRPNIWFITYDGLPQLDPDDELAAGILRKRGYICAPKIWDDPKIDWNKCQFAVMRSTWDYHRKFDAFQKWLVNPHFEGRMWNPPELMKWNSRKTYLRELENAGIDIVPTVWLDNALTSDIADRLVDETPWKKAVLKPVVGLSTFGVSILNMERKEEAQKKIIELTAARESMLQPYMEEVEKSGERSLMYMNGKFSHAIRKVAFQHFAPAGGAGERLIDPEPDEIGLAEAALRNVPHQWLYARVDVVRDPVENKPRLMELELVEPSMFMQFHPDAPQRFADAIEAKITV